MSILLNDYMTLGASLLLMLAVGTLFWKPNIVLFFYVALLVLFNSSTYGAITSDSSERFQTIYARGSGILPLSIINMSLIAIFLIAVFYHLFNKKNAAKISIADLHYGPPLNSPGSAGLPDFSAPSFAAFRRNRGMNLYFLLICLLVYCTGYLFWDSLAGIPSWLLLNDKGIINIANFVLLACVLRLVVNSPQDLRKLAQVILVAGAVRAVFGLVRMAFWGGDPSNFYENVEKSHVVLSYFDISQSILFFFCAAYLFLTWSNRSRHNRGGKWWQIGLFLLFLANIIFSFRRTAWIGLCLGLGWVALGGAKGRGKVIAVVIIGIVIVTVSGWLIGQRFTGRTSEGTKRTIASDITGKSGEVTLKQNRYAELTMAMTTLLDNNLLFGMGTAVGVDGKKISLSSFAPNHLVNTRTLYMHSGLVHILFKLGIVGLLLFAAILYKYGAGWLSARHKLKRDSQEYIIGEAAFAAFIFLIPDLLNGTPFIVFRITQIYALMLGITWVASNLGPKKID